jgi:thiamine transporter ThiT
MTAFPSVFIVIAVVILVLGIQFGIDALLTKGLIWAIAALGGPRFPFWPVFVILYIVMCIFSGHSYVENRRDK